MNSGIIRKALTTTLALELEYREPSIFCETGAESEPPADLQHSWPLSDMSVHAS